jgi:hypothetical protein
MRWEEAWGLDDAERLAAVVVSAGLEGNDFDWRTMRFTPRKP